MKLEFWALFLLPLVMTACSGTRPAHLGVEQGQPAPCPESPNCVSSQAEDPRRGIAPLTYRASRAQARENLRRVLSTMPRAKIITETPDYLHAEFT